MGFPRRCPQQRDFDDDAGRPVHEASLWPVTAGLRLSDDSAYLPAGLGVPVGGVQDDLLTRAGHILSTGDDAQLVAAIDVAEKNLGALCELIMAGEAPSHEGVSGDDRGGADEQAPEGVRTSRLSERPVRRHDALQPGTPIRPVDALPPRHRQPACRHGSPASGRRERGTV